MKIVADENLPLLQHYFGKLGELIVKPGSAMTRADLTDANILLIRSVTQVNQQLLENTPIKFVGSAVTGTDHLDIKYLEQHNIMWAAALHTNARAVVDYVITVIAKLQQQGFLTKKNLRAGVIGVGHIGTAVVKILKILGFDVIYSDPPRAKREKNFFSTPLTEFADLDFITIHTPLNFSGEYSTYHLIEKNFLQRQKKDCVILNTGRGANINSEDLKQYGQHLIWCLDVWENEPNIDLAILERAYIATPHIAGHSIQAKYRAVEYLYDFALNHHIIPQQHIERVPLPKIALDFNNSKMTWQEIILKMSDPSEIAMKEVLKKHPQNFEMLRKNFKKHELAYIVVKQVNLDEHDKKLLKKLVN